MLKNSQLLHFLLILSGIILFEYSISSCASRSSPTGGPRDTIAPRMDTSFPANFTTNFNSKTIELIFDEYISLKSPGQQIVISPPLKNQPDILLKGKRVIIEIVDTLLENTTYTISFGSSVADFTEGNVNKDIKYIFSTGSFIDSLELKGHLINSMDNLPVKELFVALYEINDSTSHRDSIPYKNIPTYYAFTDDDGRFEMEYLKSGEFLMLAFDDPQGDFKLNGNESTMAFVGEAINTGQANQEIDLISFTPNKAFKYYGARHKQNGRMVFGFSKKPEQLSVVKFGDSAQLNLNPNDEGDSLSYWFLPNDDLDSLVFLVDAQGMKTDTSIVFLKEFDNSKPLLNALSLKLKHKDTLIIQSSLPIKSINTNAFVLTSNEDTVTPVFFESTNAFEIRLRHEAKKPLSFNLYLLDSAVTSFTDSKSDSVKLQFSNLKNGDLGNLAFKVIANIKDDLVLEIFNDKGLRILEKDFNDSTLVNLKSYLPGKYSAQIIIDKNSDGKWTTGSYFKKRQAERIVKYQGEIEIRANWDLELDWNVKLSD